MENYIERAINSPENPYGRNAYRIQQEAMLRKIRTMQVVSNLEKAVDLSQYRSK